MINNLGETEQQLGNYDAALELFQLGRRLSAEIGQRVTEAYLLANMAISAFRRGDHAGSIDSATQAMQLAEELEDRDLQAIMHSAVGHAYAALGELQEAEKRYQASLVLFRELGRATMPPEPIAGLARVALARDDVSGAKAYVTEIVAHLDGGGLIDGTEDPIWIYMTCYHVLAATGVARAAEFLTSAHRLVFERAAEFTEEERASFLTNVPSNRAVVEAWSAQTRSSG